MKTFKIQMSATVDVQSKFRLEMSVRLMFVKLHKHNLIRYDCKDDLKQVENSTNLINFSEFSIIPKPIS